MAGRLAGLPSWAVTALGVLAWIAALAAVEPLVRGYLTSVPDQRLVDLNVYRTGGLSVLQGQPLYSVLTQPPQLLPFTYPPAAALFAVPLALLPWAAAQLAWVPFVYVPLAVVIGYAFAPLLRRSGRMRVVLAAIVFAACAYLFPLRDEIRFGQVDMVLLALAVADCAARAPRWPRGALVGLATAIKLIPGVFIVYLWLSGRRRAALTAVIAAAAWTIGAWLLLPHDSATYWTSVIFDSGRLGSNAGTSNQSLRGMLLRVFLPGPLPAAVWVAVAAVVAVAGFALVRRLARQSREMEAIAVTALARRAAFPGVVDPPLPGRGGGHRGHRGRRALEAPGRDRRRHRGVLRADHPLVGAVPAGHLRRAAGGRPGGAGRLRPGRAGAAGHHGPAAPGRPGRLVRPDRPGPVDPTGLA